MSPAQATAEIFWTAFSSLSKKEKKAVMERFLEETELFEDLLDSSIIEKRRHEPSISLEKVLASRKKTSS